MSTGKRYYWLKLQEDFFSSKRIKKLRRLAGGDTYTIIYLKMQLLAMRNDGILTYSGLEEDFASELALDLDEEPDNVDITIRYLLSCGLMETSDNREYFIPYVVANTGSEGSSAKRMRDYRERQASLCNKSVTQPLQICDGEKEKELEIDIIPSPNGEGSEDFLGKSSAAGKGDMQKAVDAWNSLNLKSVTKLTPDTERYIMLKKRIADYGIDEVLRAIENVRTSPFLNGHNKKGFLCTFDWFLKPNNFPKVLDGNYNDGEAPKLDPRAYDGARWLASQIAERVSGFQTPTPQELDRWARDLDTLHWNGYTWKQISDTAVWAMDDDFWSSVITSGEALRKNFVKLMAKEAATRNDD